MAKIRLHYVTIRDVNSRKIFASSSSSSDLSSRVRVRVRVQAHLKSCEFGLLACKKAIEFKFSDLKIFASSSPSSSSDKISRVQRVRVRVRVRVHIPGE